MRKNKPVLTHFTKYFARQGFPQLRYLNKHPEEIIENKP